MPSVSSEPGVRKAYRASRSAPRVTWKSSSVLRCGESVLDSIAIPAMPIRSGPGVVLPDEAVTQMPFRVRRQVG